MGEFSKDMQTQERQESPRKLSPILSTPLVFIRGDANMEKVSCRANTIFRNLLTVKKIVIQFYGLDKPQGRGCSFESMVIVQAKPVSMYRDK